MIFVHPSTNNIRNTAWNRTSDSTLLQSVGGDSHPPPLLLCFNGRWEYLSVQLQQSCFCFIHGIYLYGDALHLSFIDLASNLRSLWEAKTENDRILPSGIFVVVLWRRQRDQSFFFKVDQVDRFLQFALLLLGSLLRLRLCCNWPMDELTLLFGRIEERRNLRLGSSILPLRWLGSSRVVLWRFCATLKKFPLTKRDTIYFCEVEFWKRTAAEGEEAKKKLDDVNRLMHVSRSVKRL